MDNPYINNQKFPSVDTVNHSYLKIDSALCYTCVGTIHDLWLISEGTN